MNKKILGSLCMLLTATVFTACKNGDAEFPDPDTGTSVYFAYQYPVRTIVLGDDEYDTTLDKAHKCQIRVNFAGSYNGANGSVQIAVDNNLVNNLTFEDGSAVKAMPTDYYTLSATDLTFSGNYNSGYNACAEVQLTDKFFADPDAVKTTYVIPVYIVSQTAAAKINSGTPAEGVTSPVRTNPEDWLVPPMDYILYCVKYQNKYSGYWLTHHTNSIDNIEKANTVQITTKSLTQSVYTVDKQDGDKVYTVDLLLTFDGNENCTISSLTSGATVTGSGSWADNGAKSSWGNKDRDLMKLDYTVTVDGYTWSVQEQLVWQRSGVTVQEFAPVYNK